jgi:hypothetical protein
MLEHLLSHDIQLVLKPLGHIQMAAVIQEGDVVSEFIQTVVCDLGMQLLKLLTVMICINSTIL